MKEQDVSVDHTPTQRWVIKYISKLLQKLRQHQLEVSENWQLYETYIKVGGVEHFYIGRLILKDLPLILSCIKPEISLRP